MFPKGVKVKMLKSPFSGRKVRTPVCPVCEKGYIHFVKERKESGRVIVREYECTNCGSVLHDLKRDVWCAGRIQNELKGRYLRMEQMSQAEVNILSNAVLAFMGVGTIDEITHEAIWGIFDPLYGLYQKKGTARGMTSNESREIVENLFNKYPKTVLNYFANVSKKASGQYKMRLMTLINLISKNCPRCRTAIPKNIRRCPHCRKPL